MTDTAIRFDEQVVVVTGAGRGLGRSHAVLMASLGARVLVNDAGRTLAGTTESSPADTVVDEIRAAGGIAHASTHDVTDASDVEEMIETAQTELGGLDAVVNNAGFLRDSTLVKMSEHDLRSVIDVHLVGGLLVAQAAMRVFTERGYGRIVFTTSGSGIYGNFGQVNYAAAKAGLIGATKALALEGATKGICVNAVAPGALTRMNEDIPLGRVAPLLTTEAVSPLFAYLCSTRCDTTGSVYESAGGQHRRIMTGATAGWFGGPDAAGGVDDIAARWPEINDDRELAFPNNAIEANRSLFRNLRRSEERS